MERGKKNIKYSMKIKMFNSHFTAKGAGLQVYKETNIKVMMALRDAVTYKKLYHQTDVNTFKLWKHPSS